MRGGRLRPQDAGRQPSAPLASHVQESVNLHLTLGNPSDAKVDAGDKDNHLLVKPQFVFSYNDSRGVPNWVKHFANST